MKGIEGEYHRKRNKEREKKEKEKEKDKEKIGWKDGRRGRKGEQSSQVSFSHLLLLA